jgi:hypothetical protein
MNTEPNEKALADSEIVNSTIDEISRISELAAKAGLQTRRSANDPIREGHRDKSLSREDSILIRKISKNLRKSEYSPDKHEIARQEKIKSWNEYRLGMTEPKQEVKRRLKQIAEGRLKVAC